MRFRKYSRRHAFNILYQWDITGENLSKISEEYWKTLESLYNYSINLAEELLNKIENNENIDVEIYEKKFETLSEEEIIAEKLRNKLFTTYILLKSIEEFHNFTLTYTGWISEKSKQKLEKAIEILNSVIKELEALKVSLKEYSEQLEELISYLKGIKEQKPNDFEALKVLEENFQKKVFEIIKELLKEIKEFALKRVNEDMGEIKEYAEKLLRAYDEHKVEVDSTIEEFLKDWTIDGLGSVERNLLRLGTAEFMYVGVQDPGRAFNDYIDFAKAFVGKKAAKFVNGVLSAIYNKKVAKKEEA
jgi:N utilization substance protein B